MKKILLLVIFLIPILAFGQVSQTSDTTVLNEVSPNYSKVIKFGQFNGFRLPYLYNEITKKSDLLITGSYFRVFGGGGGGTITPVRLSYSAGTALPITLISFQALYSIYGSNPKITCMKITGLSPFSFLNLTGQATITITEIIALFPDSIAIEVDDDGTGHLADNILIIISI